MTQPHDDRFFAGHVVLDFVDTIADKGKSRSRSTIPDWDSVVEWATAANIVVEDEAGLSPTHEGECELFEDEVTRLHEFRESTWRALRSVAGSSSTDEADLHGVGSVIQAAYSSAQLEPVVHDCRFVWHVPAPVRGAYLIRMRLALMLSDLLTSHQLGRLKECARCTGLFLDYGRGRGRKWCRMETCGNRVKYERHRRRIAE